VIGEGISLADLKGTLLAFARDMFSPTSRVRFRPSFFPYTEPSAEIDISCWQCDAAGCAMCKQSGWLEVGGSGMVHPAVFEAVGYDPERYTGFAWGIGIERVAFSAISVDDIRLFFENDLRFWNSSRTSRTICDYWSRGSATSSTCRLRPRTSPTGSGCEDSRWPPSNPLARTTASSISKSRPTGRLLERARSRTGDRHALRPALTLPSATAGAKVALASVPTGEFDRLTVVIEDEELLPPVRGSCRHGEGRASLPTGSPRGSAPLVFGRSTTSSTSPTTPSSNWAIPSMPSTSRHWPVTRFAFVEHATAEDTDDSRRCGTEARSGDARHRRP